MDQLADEAVEFKSVVTSAPSTVMSISAMMTSLPSYFLGRNYSDFRFDNKFFITLSELLKGHGYISRALIMHREIREKLRVFDLVPRKYWPKGFSHSQWWDNSKIVELLRNTLRIDRQHDKDSKQPVFWFLDFNCREDPKTSDYVRESIELLKENGYDESNTIFLLCSDHGYPDPSRGITPELLKQNKMTHDIFMTDDNIMIPMVFSYPGCPKGHKVNETVSSLDFTPTILEILDALPDAETVKNWKGQSLLNLIDPNQGNKYESKKVRTDARFMGQPGRVSALRDKNFKYVYHHDTGAEEFVDVSTFSIDEVDIKDSVRKEIAQAYSEFRREFSLSEQEGMEKQIDYFAYKLASSFSSHSMLQKGGPLRICVVSDIAGAFCSTLATAMRKTLPQHELEIRLLGSLYSEQPDGVFDGSSLLSDNLIPADSKFDAVIVATDSASNQRLIATALHKLSWKKKLVVDANMTVSIHQGQLARYLRTLWVNRQFYFEEPLLVIPEMKKAVRALCYRLGLL